MILSNLFHHGIYITRTLPRVVWRRWEGNWYMKRKWPSGLYGVSSLIIGPPFPPAPLIATSTIQSEGNTLRKCLDSFSRQSTSVASCSSCPVPFQGASVLPVAHTRPYKSTRESSLGKVLAWLWCKSVVYWCGYPFMVKSQLQGCVRRLKFL